jgi:hypothetical protein
MGGDNTHQGEVSVRFTISQDQLTEVLQILQEMGAQDISCGKGKTSTNNGNRPLAVSLRAEGNQGPQVETSPLSPIRVTALSEGKASTSVETVTKQDSESGHSPARHPSFSPDSSGSQPRPPKRCFLAAQVQVERHTTKRWVKFTSTRSRLINRCLRDWPDLTPEQFGKAVVLGYLRLYRGKDDFDWMRYLTPETLFRPGNAIKYIEAEREAVIRERKQREREQLIRDRDAAYEKPPAAWLKKFMPPLGGEE